MTHFKLMTMFRKARTLNKRLAIAYKLTEQYGSKLTHEQYQYYLMFIDLYK